MTGTGPKILLPNSYANEVKTNPNLSLDKAFAKVRRELKISRTGSIYEPTS